MARIRSLKPEFFKHPGLCELPIVARYFFAGLWCQADRDGRLKDRPRALKLEIAPWDDIDPEMVLAELAKGGFIQRYEVDGEQYISIHHFAKHQRPHPKEPKSEIPQPTKPPRLSAVERNGETRPAVEINGTPSKQGPAVERNGEPGGLLSLGSGGKAGGGILVHDPPPPPPGSALADYLRDTWPAIEGPEKIATLWREKWPGLELLSEAKKARAYELETGKKHDSPGSFLRSWFRRAKAPQVNGTTPAPRAVPTAKDSTRMLDERDRPFHEDRARGRHPKASESREWLHMRWPDKYPDAGDERWKELA